MGVSQCGTKKGPHLNSRKELRATAGNGTLYYVQSHGNLNLAAISASEITGVSGPSVPVMSVDLRVGCRLRNSLL